MAISYFVPTVGYTANDIPSEDGSLQSAVDKVTHKRALPVQVSPILHTYSPRLFGAPPQLTSLNDMRLLSAKEDTLGPVGDFYLTKILQNAQIANFVVGKALFTGGMSSGFGIISQMIKYAMAMQRYDIFGDSAGVNGTGGSPANAINVQEMKDNYEKTLTSDDGQVGPIKTTIELSDGENEDAVLDLSNMPEAESAINSIAGVVGGITASLLTSLSVQQPFYTFESDWHSYIECVKMMINTAVIQLGLQNACVKVGDQLIPIGMMGSSEGKNEPWSQYSSWISQNTGLLNSSSVTGLDTMTGDTAQYVSFMIDPAGMTETFTNSVGESQIYSSVINQGSEIGSEIAFLTNASANSVDDAIIDIAGGAIGAAEKVLTAMTAGVGRFTAAVAGSFARTFVGNHTIYPQVFKSHSSTQTRDITIHLNASGGDPYSYLMDILVPYFFILGMALPQLSKNNAASYSYPPLVQCNIPGIWGTRLGMVTSVTVNKNQSGRDISVNGYPLSVDITMTVTDLQHVLMTSPQDRVSTFLNNHTMFDYIATCAGVDKYRPNGAMRLVSRLALASHQVNNIGAVFKNAILSDFTSLANRIVGNYNL